MPDTQAVNEETPIPKTGEQVASRIQSVASALKMAKQLIYGDKQRSLNRARVQGQINGNPPYDKSKLKRLGQGHRANLNFRDAEAFKDRRKTSFYELLLEVEHLVNVRIRDRNGTNDDLDEYGSIIAEEFTRMVFDWDGFLVNILLHMDELVVHGVNTLYWPDEYDWRFKTTRMGQFLLPENTEPTADGISYCVIRSSFKVDELYKRVETVAEENRSRVAGWDIDMIKKAIWKAVMGSTVQDGDEFQLGAWENVQQKIKENDLVFSSTQKQEILIDHILVKEHDGKVSHFIILESDTEDKTLKKPTAFLFKKQRRFKSFKNFVVITMTSIGEGTYHTIRGLGTKVFGHCQLNDRVKNTVVDGGMTAATLLLQSPNEAAKQKARVTSLGPVTLLPSGFTVIQQQFNPNLGGLINVIGMLDSGLKGNIGIQRPDVTPEPGSRPPMTIGDAKNKEYREAKLEKTDINMYYATIDKLWNETIRRALSPKYTTSDHGYQSAKAFKDACEERGVPKMYLNAEKLIVRATRAIGLGSAALRAITAEDILGASEYYDEIGKQNALRDYVAVKAGYVNVERYAGRRNRNRLPTSEHTIASLENNDHRRGEQTIVGQDEPHVIHLLVHLDPLMSAAQQWMQGDNSQPAEQIVVYFETALRHSAQHLDYLANDESRVNETAGFMQQFDELMKVFSVMQKQANSESKTRQREAERQQKVVQEAETAVQSDELKAQLAKIGADFKLHAMKEQGLQQVREQKAQHSMIVKERLAQQKMRLAEEESVRKG